MDDVAKWFDRKFTFSFGAELYPNVLARLRGTPARLDETLRNCPQDILVRQPAGKWSAQEHAGHLLDLESLWLSRARDYLAEGNELPAADLNNRRTHESNHNGRDIGELLDEFRSARITFVTAVEGFEPDLFSRAKLHPRLKQPMRLVDHLYFVAEHDDHHVATMWELVRATKKSQAVTI